LKNIFTREGVFCYLPLDKFENRVYNVGIKKNKELIGKSLEDLTSFERYAIV